VAFGRSGDSDGGRYGAATWRKQNPCLLRLESFEENPKARTDFFVQAIKIVSRQHNGRRFKFYDSAKD